MINNKIKFAFVLAVLAGFLVLGFNSYKQGLSIALMEEKYNANRITINGGSLPPASIPKDNHLLESMEKQSSITGSLVALSEEQLTVEVYIPDTSLLAKTDTSKPFTVEQIKKVYKVEITNRTVFEKKKYAELKVGDVVSVTSSSPVIGIDKFEGLSVTSIDLPRGIPAKTN